ncbi:hypothetical protein LCGC14_1704410 [marine sediment metagenome]|uniref:Uncharacterized protein n=1 Tax=marine sediment metagenome TaxID=412755 RepID=A0A0F9JXJ5_9ZZZZ
MNSPSVIYADSDLAIHKTLYTVEEFPVGQTLEYGDGRRYHFALAGELLVVAEILMGQDSTAESGLTPVAAAVGDTTLSVTLGAATVADYFKGGTAYVEVTPALGDSYKIGPHAAFSAAAAQLIPLAGDETIKTAITATSRITVVRNTYAGLISVAVDATQTGVIAGVAVSLIANAQWGWVQTRGPCPVLSGDNTGEGLAFAASDNSVGSGALKNADIEFVIGCVMQTGTADGDTQLIYLTID